MIARRALSAQPYWRSGCHASGSRSAVALRRAEHDSHHGAAWHADSNVTVRTTGVLIAAVLAFAVQQTSIVPAVHDVQRSLGGSDEWASWLVTVYLMVATVATMAMGRLGDLYGRRRMLLVGLGVFAVGSVGGAVAPDLGTLIGCRALQGVGGSVYPLTLALARENVPDKHVTAALSILSGAFGAGTAIGFVAGGMLGEYVSWRAIFGVGAVLVVLAGLLVWRYVPAAGARASGRYDLFGSVTFSIAAIALLAGVTLVTTIGAAAPATVGLLVLALAATVVSVRHTRRTEEPLVDLAVFRNRKVVVANLATIGLGWSLFGSYLLLPQLARQDPETAGYGLGVHSGTVGLLMLPLALAQSVCAPLAGRLSRRLPARVVFAGGLVLVTAGVAILAVTGSGTARIVVAMLLLGAGVGAALQAGSVVATEAVPSDVAGVSASVNSTVRRLAGGVGGQISTLLLVVTASSGFVGYTVAYSIAGGLCLLAAPAVLLATRGSAGS